MYPLSHLIQVNASSYSIQLGIYGAQVSPFRSRIYPSIQYLQLLNSSKKRQF